MGDAAEAPEEAPWQQALAGRHDRRFFEVVASELREQFELRVLLARDTAGKISALQPAFLVDQDLLAATPSWVRGIASGRLRLRTLMIGNPAGECGPGWAADPEATARFAACAAPMARQLGASIVVVKDVPVKFRPQLEPFLREGFQRIPSMPAVRLRIDFKSFEEYMTAHLTRVTRKDLRRKFRESLRLTMEVLTDVEPVLNEVYPLYQQVFARSKLRFEKLTREFLLGLGRRMPDKTRFFVWRIEGRAVAFSVCIVSDGVLHDEYLGMDYKVAHRHSLWFRTFRDLLTWAIENGLEEYYSTPLGYEPKRRLGFELAPLDVYVRHTGGGLNLLFRPLVKWLAPVRSERVLRAFPNASELW